MPIRPTVQHVEVYNEGLTVYLHDPKNAADIIKLNPTSVLDVGNVEPAKDKALKEATERGLLVVYHLRQDDPIAVDVCVGPLLSKEEIKKFKIPLMKPVQTVLSLPSGVLCIDTPNTFRLSAESRETAEEYRKIHGKLPAKNDHENWGVTDPGGTAKVPPGDYVLTLYRIDVEKLPDDDEDEENEENEIEFPGEILVLTPAGKIDRPKKIPRVIEYGSGPRVSGLNNYKVQGKVFEGLVVGGANINLRWPQARQLGLRRGQRLRIEEARGDVSEAVFVGGAEPLLAPDVFEVLYPDRLATLHKREQNLLTAGIRKDDIIEVELLRVASLEPGKFLTGERGRVKITALDDFAVPPPERGDPSQGEWCAPQGKDTRGTIKGIVLAAGNPGFELGCGLDLLKKLTRESSVELQLEVAGRKLPLLLVPDSTQGSRPHHIIGSLRSADAEMYMKVFSYMIDGGDVVFRAMLGRNAAPISALLQAYKKGCTFTPSDGYVPKDKALGKRQREEWMALWREGLKRWNVPEAMRALPALHWDGPPFHSLSCRWAQYTKDAPFIPKTGSTFVLRSPKE